MWTFCVTPIQSTGSETLKHMRTTTVVYLKYFFWKYYTFCSPENKLEITAGNLHQCSFNTAIETLREENDGAHYVAALTVRCIMIHCSSVFGSKSFGPISSNLRQDTCSIVATPPRSQFTCCFTGKGLSFSCRWDGKQLLFSRWMHHEIQRRDGFLDLIVCFIFASTDRLEGWVVPRLNAVSRVFIPEAEMPKCATGEAERKEGTSSFFLILYLRHYMKFDWTLLYWH